MIAIAKTQFTFWYSVWHVKVSLVPSCKINLVYLKNYHDKRINYNHCTIRIRVLRELKTITPDWLLKQQNSSFNHPAETSEESDKTIENQIYTDFPKGSRF